MQHYTDTKVVFAFCFIYLPKKKSCICFLFSQCLKTTNWCTLLTLLFLAALVLISQLGQKQNIFGPYFAIWTKHWSPGFKETDGLIYFLLPKWNIKENESQKIARERRLCVFMCTIITSNKNHSECSR